MKKIAIILALASLGACGSEFIDSSENGTEVKDDSNKVVSLNREIEAAITRQANVDDLQNLLSERKAVMLKLASNDPKKFLSSVLSDSTLQKLPDSLQSLAEKKLSHMTGSLEVEISDDFENRKSTTQYYVQNKGEQNKLYVDGILQPTSGQDIALDAYNLDGTFVARADDVQSKSLVPSTLTVGNQKLLVILIEYLDSPAEPFTRKEAKSLVFDGPFTSFVSENSHGRASYSGRNTKWIRLPSNGPTISSNSCKRGQLSDPAVTQELAAEGIDLSNYQGVAFLINHPNVYGGCSYLGKTTQYDANGNSYYLSMSWMTLVNYNQQHWVNPPFSFTNLDYFLSHEVAGHGNGVLHSNGWECGVGTIFGSQSCFHVEYGGADIMASGTLGEHINALYQVRLGWIDESSVTTITSTGTYGLTNLESDTGKRMAKIIDPNSSRYLFVIEYRRPVGYDSVLSYSDRKINAKGIFIYYVNYGLSGYPVELLDMTPTQTGWDTVDENGAGDGLLVSLTDTSTLPDKMFKDPISGISIGPILSQGASKIKFKVTFP